MKCHVSSLPVNFALTMQPASDPADWHTGPYCHIYIAAVENVEQYRAKVRPALRAFVNQIEGSGTMAATTSSSGGIVGSSAGGRSGITSAGSTIVAPGGKQPRPSSAGSNSGGGGGGGGGSGASPNRGSKSANEKALARAGLLAGKSIVSGNFGSRYIIVFVPTGAAAAAAPSLDSVAGVGKKSGTESVVGSNHSGGSVSGSDFAGGGGGFGGFRAGRKGLSGGVVLSSPPVRADLDDSQSLTTIVSSPLPPHDNGNTSVTRVDDSHHSAAASAAPPPGPIAHSSKEVKELYHKFLKDFLNFLDI